MVLPSNTVRVGNSVIVDALREIVVIPMFQAVSK